MEAPLPTGRRITQRFEQLKKLRAPHELHWEAMAEVMMPRKRGIARSLTPGTKLTDLQYDGTATRAAERLASFMHGSMTASNFPWFGLQTRNVELMDVKAVADWLEECGERMLAAFAMSNWDSEAPECYLDNMVFGTAAPLFVEEDDIEIPGQQFGGLHFRALPLGESWMAENRKGRIDTLYWLSTMPAIEIAQAWSDTVSAETRNLAETKPYDLVNVLLAIEPRRNAPYWGDPERRFAWELPFAAWYLEHDRAHILEETGFYDFPAPTPRWSRGNADKVYGRGLGDSAYPDVKTLNEAVRLKLMSLALALFPPLIKDTGMAGSIRWLPGAVHDAPGKALGLSPPVQPILNGARFDVAEVEEEKYRSIIDQAFHGGLLQLPEKEMTAREAQLRLQLMLRVLGPGVLGRHKAEFLDPVISLAFGIMFRGGALPPPPDEIRRAAPHDRSIDVVYKGPLAMAQRSQDTMAIDSQLDATLAVYERTEDPEVLDTMNIDEALYHRAEGSSVPSKVMRGKDEVARRRAARAEAEATARAREERTQMADEMLKTAAAGKASSEAPGAGPAPAPGPDAGAGEGAPWQ